MEHGYPVDHRAWARACFLGYFCIGNHILSGVYRTSVEEYEQILEKLREKGVISKELYEELRGLGGFRNILVHGYLSLDPELVYYHFKKALHAFPRFIAEIEEWLESLPCNS